MSKDVFLFFFYAVDWCMDIMEGEFRQNKHVTSNSARRKMAALGIVMNMDGKKVSPDQRITLQSLW